jgi:tetratricopeptide (TPR) repeat protein
MQGPTVHSRVRLLVLLAVLPNLIWVALDKTPWPWDQAYYGRYSVELFFTLIRRPSEWLPAMLNVFGRMAPGIAWIGQFFVPFGVLIGSIDAALLLSVTLVQAAGLLLMFAAIRELSDRRLWIGVTALIVMASAPLAVALSHYYLVETMQTTAVAWFVLVMALAPRWCKVMTASQLLLATAFAMLAKVSSPIYCAGPGLVGLYYVVRAVNAGRTARNTRVGVTLALGLIISTATAAWYYKNFQRVVAHVSMAASGPVAELYGKHDQFLGSMTYWLSVLQTAFFYRPTVFLASGVLIAGIVVSAVRPQPDGGRFGLAAAVSALQIVIVLSVLSLNSNRDNRYLLPILPHVALILCWSLSRLDRRIVTLAVIVAFALQWGHVQAEALGLIERDRNTSPWLNAPVTDAQAQRILDALVLKTCVDKTPESYWNVVGVQLAWLNAPGVSYAAAKRLLPGNMLKCDYDAITYFETDEDQVWRRLVSKNVAYYVALDSTAYAVPSTPADMAINELNEPILRRVENSGLFQLEGGPEELGGIQIFRRVDRIDHLALGRTLSDQGKHQRAIEELSKATSLDPTNIETWANLALAYERQGDYEKAVSAGIQARTLNFHHYYVNLDLARAFLERREWANAIARAEDAALDARDGQERAAAWALAAKASFSAGESTRGCDFLGRAIHLHSSGELLGEVARNCAR